jgi:hypothetical protein
MKWLSLKLCSLLFAGVAATALVPALALGQDNLVGSVGLGVALAVGESDNVVDDGYTVRGQVAREFGLFAVTAQTGWTRLLAATDGNADKDLDLWHAGVGGRVVLGPVFGGLNAFYNFGDTSDKGFDLIPELGVKVWRLELVGDARFDQWAALRLGYRF